MSRGVTLAAVVAAGLVLAAVLMRRTSEADAAPIPPMPATAVPRPILRRTTAV